jgi:hypothetical protein
VSSVVRRARCSCLRLGQWLRKSQNSALAFSSNHALARGKVLLQRAGQAVGDPRLLIDEFPSLFQQAFERANADALWLQGFQLVAVAQKDLQRDLRIGRIGLGVAGLEGLTILRQGGGIHRKQDKEVMFLQRVDQRSAGDLETDGQRLAVKALPERSGPLINGVGAMGQHGEFTLAASGRLQADVVFRIGPVDADEGGEFWVGFRSHSSYLQVLEWRNGTCLPGRCESNIESR